MNLKRYQDLFEKYMVKVCCISCFFLPFIVVGEEHGYLAGILAGFVGFLVGIVMLVYVVTTANMNW